MTGLEGIYLEGLIHGGAYFRNFMVFSALVMSLRMYITQALRDNNLITTAFKSDCGCAKIAVQ